MGLKAIVDTLDSVPEQFRELYTERNGKFELTEVEGMRTQADIDRVQTALTKERNDHRGTKEKYSALSGMDISDVLQKLDRIPELEALANGKVDETKIEELVNGRLRSKLAPIERERDTFKTQLTETQNQLKQYEAEKIQRLIGDKVRSAATAAKLLPEAIEDALLLAERVFEVAEDGRVVTKDGVGVTPGVDPSVWFTDLQAKRPHWWGPSVGGGARGGANGGVPTNPWSAEHWNMTAQGQIYNSDPTKAEQMAKSAGTTIGGARPAPKK